MDLGPRASQAPAVQGDSAAEPGPAWILFPATSLSWSFSETVLSQFREPKESQIISFFGREAPMLVGGQELWSGMLSCAGVKCHLFQLFPTTGHILPQILPPPRPVGINWSPFSCRVFLFCTFKEWHTWSFWQCVVVMVATGEKGQQQAMVSSDQLPPTSGQLQLEADLIPSVVVPVTHQSL